MPVLPLLGEVDSDGVAIASITGGSENETSMASGRKTVRLSQDEIVANSLIFVLAGYETWEHSDSALTEEDPDEVFHNPSPNML